jgi:type II secretory pathway component PulF
MEMFLKPIAIAIAIVLAIAAYIGPFAVFYGVYWLMSMPLRRRERARLFLDLLETGVNDGHAAEHVIVEAAHTKDPMLGARFHLLAAYLEEGVRLPEALAKVPRLLPPEVAAMLKVGAELGDIRRVLPACRQTLNDALSQTRGALNYLAITVFVLLPSVPVLTWMISVFVLPKFEMIARDMTDDALPMLTQVVFGMRYPFVLFEVLAMLTLQFLAVCYIAGPRLRQALRAVPPLGWLIDRLFWTLPWRRKRMQRDFATMLALLLDAGVPEGRALKISAEATNNSLFIRRARAAVYELARGVKLPEAVRALDGHRELEWRLTNAAHNSSGFVAALRGWFEALDAKAFQQEQAAAQTFTTAVVLWNGLVVGAFVVAVFQFLTSLTQNIALW